MKYDYRKVAGTLLFVGSVQFILALIITEALYSGYSVSENSISDLGVGTNSFIFNASVFLLGALTVAGACYIQRAFGSTLVSVVLIMTGLGALGVGLFPKTTGVAHDIASLITFLFAGLSAIASYKLQKPPLSYLSVLAGAFSLVALGLYISGAYLGLGNGGMERMIVSPVLSWAIGFGSHLVGSSDDTAPSTKS